MWSKFPKKKPKKNGWYICLIEFKVDQETYQSYVMDLYWYSDKEKFMDNRRKNVFSEYLVYNYESEKIDRDHLCDRTASVVAWKNQVRKPKRFLH